MPETDPRNLCLHQLDAGSFIPHLGTKLPLGVHDLRCMPALVTLQHAHLFVHPPDGIHRRCQSCLKLEHISWVDDLYGVLADLDRVYGSIARHIDGRAILLWRGIGFHIRVHVICPGGVATEMVTQMRPDLDPSGLIQPHEIAETVVFLVTRRGKAAIDQIDVRRESNIPWA